MLSRPRRSVRSCKNFWLEDRKATSICKSSFSSTIKNSTSPGELTKRVSLEESFPLAVGISLFVTPRWIRRRRKYSNDKREENVLQHFRDHPPPPAPSSPRAAETNAMLRDILQRIFGEGRRYRVVAAGRIFRGLCGCCIRWVSSWIYKPIGLSLANLSKPVGELYAARETPTVPSVTRKVKLNCASFLGFPLHPAYGAWLLTAISGNRVVTLFT